MRLRWRRRAEMFEVRLFDRTSNLSESSMFATDTQAGDIEAERALLESDRRDRERFLQTFDRSRLLGSETGFCL